MDKHRKLADLMGKWLTNGKNIPIIAAKVVSIEGESCTVDLDGLELPDVRLKATINGEANKILLLPKVGTMVLIGSLTGDLKDLCVLKVDEVEILSYEQSGLKIEVDSTDGKLNVQNDNVTLKEILQALADLLKQFKVFTSIGPSGTPLPDTVTAITQFETKFKSLLK